MKKSKVIRGLFVGDGGVASGFARVMESIIQYLPDNYEAHHLAVNYTGDPYKTNKNHLMYPARNGGDLLGIKRIENLIENIKPDFIFILNDPWVINDYLTRIPKGQTVIAYTPVDAEHLHKGWVENLSKIDQLIVYTEFGKNEYLRKKPDFENIKVIPHGTDLSKFYPIDKIEARKKIGLPEDAFIVFNGNRNQPRKRVDLTLKAFAKFAEGKPENVLLHLHMGMVDAGYHVLELANRYGIGDRVKMTNPKLSPGNHVSEEDLNRIYNSMDAGLNTSMGEGWGLVNVEHACCKVPQVVPNFSATKEIFEPNMALHINYERTEPHLGILTEGCIIDIDHAAECMERLYQDRELGKSLAENAYNKFTRKEYTWKSVSNEFLKVFEEVLSRPKKEEIK